MDGLFFKKPILASIHSKGWEFIVVWKDKTRYDLQDVVALHKEEGKVGHIEYTEFPSKNKRHEYIVEWSKQTIEKSPIPLYYLRGDKKEISTQPDIVPQDTKFIFVSSLPIDKSTAKEIFLGGKRRWMIENEGFNYQKNSRLNLHHKMNRHNIWAIKNYYICLQMAHLISQLLSLNKSSILKTFKTLKEAWAVMLSYLKITQDYQPDRLKPKYNLRY